MKIVKQIDESHFEIEMDKWDKNKELAVFVAHDYLSISGPSSFCTNLDIKGEYCTGAINCLHRYVDIQIPIRAAQEILKLLEGNKYLKPEHLKLSGGKSNYLWDNNPIKFKDEKGNWKVAIRADDEEEYSIISLNLYNKLTK